MKITAIIQARCGSTRLPRKVLMNLEGKSVLERVVERVKHSSYVDQIVVATTINEDDDEIETLCKGIGVNVFRGSVDDVLDRFYQASKRYGGENIVRITADCPLLDPNIVDKVIACHIESRADYTTNTIKETYPDGEDVEIFTFASLEKAWSQAALKSEREHVTPYLRKNPDIFKQMSVESSVDLSEMRWTLDNAEDFIFISAVYKKLHQDGSIFKIDDVLRFMR